MRLILLLCMTFFSISSFASDASLPLKVEDLTARLQNLYAYGVHTHDQPRVYILLKASEEVTQSLKTNGLIHRATTGAMINLIIKFKFSTLFFDFIQTSANTNMIAGILNDVESIKSSLGYDDEPYTKVLKSNLTQILSITQSLLKDSQLSTSTKDKLNNFRVLLANSIAEADQGDRPRAFKLASDVYFFLRSIYPDLDSLNQDKARFSLYLELVGLNEFIGEYSQANY